MSEKGLTQLFEEKSSEPECLKTVIDETPATPSDTSEDGIEYTLATEEEITNLPHVSDSIPLPAWIVIIAGAFERAAYFGVIAPWQNYMQNPRRLGAVPGALDLGQSTATNIYNAFFLISFLTPMFFALLADIKYGRYKTLIVGMIMYLTGCILLLVTSLPTCLYRGAGLGGLLGSMFLIAMGAGAVKAAYFPFLGDQLPQGKPRISVRKDGKKVVVDATKTLQLAYNVYYWFTNVAAMSTVATTFLEKHIDFWAAYTLPAASLLVSTAILVLCSGKLVKHSPQGNNLPIAAKATVCAAKSNFKLDHARPEYQRKHFGRTVSWTDTFVDELKRGFHACRVLLSLLLFYLTIDQIFNNLVSQAGQMTLHGIPNDMIQAFSGVGCVVLGPVIQYLYTYLAKHKISFGPIARITAAFLFCGAGMAYAAGVQRLIYNSGPCFDRPLACAAAFMTGEKDAEHASPNDINVWVQTPVYFILAAAEILGFVTVSEYAYTEAPKDMKTIVQAFTQLIACVSAALGMALSPVSRDPYLVTMYACLAGVMAINAVLFYWWFRGSAREMAKKVEETERQQEADMEKRDV